MHLTGRSITIANISLALLFSAWLYSRFSLAEIPSVTTTYNAKSGIYCVEGGTFYQKQNPDGNLTIELDTAGGPPDHGMFSIYGQAEKVADHHWLYKEGLDSSDPNDRCAVDITLDEKGWRLKTRPDATCASFKGAHAPDEAPFFPLSSYVGPVTTQLNADGGLAANGGNASSADDCNSQFPYTSAPKP